MAAAVVLDFKNLKILTVRHAKNVELLHCAQFRLNRSNRGRDMAIFQDGGRRHLEFSKFQIFNCRNGQEGRTASPCQILSKSLEPRRTCASFNIMRVGLKMLIYAPFLVGNISHK